MTLKTLKHLGTVEVQTHKLKERGDGGEQTRSVSHLHYNLDLFCLPNLGNETHNFPFCSYRTNKNCIQIFITEGSLFSTTNKLNFFHKLKETKLCQTEDSVGSSEQVRD